MYLRIVQSTPGEGFYLKILFGLWKPFLSYYIPGSIESCRTILFMLTRISQLYYFIYLGHSVHHVFVLVNKHRIHYHLFQSNVREKDIKT